MTEPTDAELDAVLCNHWPAFSMQATLVRMWVRAAMRDALAQWGTPPAVAGEPIGYLYCGGSYGDELADWEIVADQHQCDKLNEHHGALGKEAKLPLYTTPQPTQAQAGAVPQHQPTPDVQAKMAVNQWDHFGDILPTLKAISRGDWYWGANSRCKYIEIRLDTRDGGCLLFDRERVRISPAQFAHQSHSVRMEPWPGIKGADHG